MSDTTTEGYVVSAHEIDGMVRNLCAYALSELDPVQRYLDLTHQQVLFQGMVEAIQRARGRAIADVLVAGMSADEVISKTNLTTPLQVTKLLKVSGETDRVKDATKPAKAPKATKAAKPAKAVKGGGRSAAMLPPVGGPGERRILTPDELAALGLPPKQTPAKPGPSKPGEVKVAEVKPAESKQPVMQAPKTKEPVAAKESPRVKKGLLRKKRAE